MSSYYVGEIRMFGGNFAPQQWAFCNGQAIAIAQNQALYTLIGTTYGGDGRTTFNLPNLQGRLAIGQGQGPGLSNRSIGETGGAETVQLTQGQLPSHTHPLNASTAVAATANVSGSVTANTAAASGVHMYVAPKSGDNPPQPKAMAATAVGIAGGNQPHDNMMPYLCVSFIIALYGIFPTQN